MAREGVEPHKVAIVPNWVDTRLIRPAARETAYRQKAGLEGKFVVLFAGMLGFAQDIDTIVEAGTFLGSRRGIVVLVVGGGGGGERLEGEGGGLGGGNLRLFALVADQGHPGGVWC